MPPTRTAWSTCRASCTLATRDAVCLFVSGSWPGSPLLNASLCPAFTGPHRTGAASILLYMFSTIVCNGRVRQPSERGLHCLAGLLSAACVPARAPAGCGTWRAWSACACWRATTRRCSRSRSGPPSWSPAPTTPPSASGASTRCAAFGSPHGNPAFYLGCLSHLLDNL